LEDSQPGPWHNSRRIHGIQKPADRINLPCYLEGAASLSPLEKQVLDEMGYAVECRQFLAGTPDYPESYCNGVGMGQLLGYYPNAIM
jgi:hypothetical protein